MFDNFTTEALADEIGQIDQMVKALEERLKAAKDEFKSRGVEKASGSRFAVAKTIAIRACLDQKAVLSEMGQKWWDDHCNLTEVATLRIKSVAAPMIIVKAE